MARTDGLSPEFGPDTPTQAGETAAPLGDVLPAFFVDSAGVATPGGMLRGEGFTMRDGDTPDSRRSRRRLH